MEENLRDPYEDWNKDEVARTLRDECWDWRDGAYDIISRGLFTEDELVNKYGFLTKRAYDHILTYPERKLELDMYPFFREDPEKSIIPGNVDVLFFGVCGSGGKTSLMAALMTLVRESSGFEYQESFGDKKCDNSYGVYLAEYMKTNRFPPTTQTDIIQVVNTRLYCGGKHRGVSFIEFSGEQVHDLAGNSAEEGLTGGRLYPSLIKILNNNNKKIIFLTLDPTNLKRLSMFTGDSPVWVTQPVVLECVISHFSKNPKFMRNVIGFHPIMSKSDVWLKGSLSSSISQAIQSMGAESLLGEIEWLCRKYKINSHQNGDVEPIPFTIGKFMWGETYEFDDGDANKLLGLIRKDIEVYEAGRTVLARLKDYFNH